MNTTKITLLAILGFLVLTIFWAVGANNGLVQQDEAVKSAWSQVENVYQRRADLVPNLVNTVKGYATHEKETLEGVVQARSLALTATNQSRPTSGAPDSEEKLKTFSAAQQALGSAIGRLLVVVERYPDLKANENFRDLQAQLEGTENRIAVERRRFNETAQAYNSSIRMFPTSVIARWRGFAARPYFESQPSADKAPEVKF